MNHDHKQATSPPSSSKNTLDTFCPNCHSHFSLEPKQREARQGFVRCGLCLHVFNVLSAPIIKTATYRPTEFLKKRSSNKLRWISSLLLCFITVTLALTLFFREKIIEYFPASAATLQPICRLLLCTLPPAYYIDAVEITHSELLKGKEPDTYVLHIILQNHANFIVSLPAIEASLINPQGKLISRRILTPSDYLSAQQHSLQRNGLKENSALPLDITLHSKEAAASYHLFSFYP